MFGPKGRSLNIQQCPLGFGAGSYVNLKLDNLSNQQKKPYPSGNILMYPHQMGKESHLLNYPWI